MKKIEFFSRKEQLPAAEAILSERKELSHYSRRAGRVASIFLLASVLAACGGKEEAQLKSKNVPTKGKAQAAQIEQEPVRDAQEARQIMESVDAETRESSIPKRALEKENVGESGTWVDSYLSRLQTQEQNLAKASTPEEKKFYINEIQNLLNELKQEFYFPTQGDFVEIDAPYGIEDAKVRKMTPEDSRYLQQRIQEIKVGIQRIDGKHGTNFSQLYGEQLDNMLEQAKQAPLNAQQAERIKQLEKLLNQ